uniref:Uncharacterized protein n=1 Tax=Romanomermis culicivorax TaxID=13658 RepID=A0A915JEA5_ROMCU
MVENSMEEPNDDEEPNRISDVTCKTPIKLHQICDFTSPSSYIKYVIFRFPVSNVLDLGQQQLDERQLDE